MLIYIYVIYELNPLNNVTQSIGIILLADAPENMLATLHIYVPLQCYYNLQIDPRVLHRSLKNNKMQL